jgi:hypothetical protein
LGGEAVGQQRGDFLAAHGEEGGRHDSVLVGGGGHRKKMRVLGLMGR